MHEMSICEGMLQVFEKHAQVHGFSRVKKVRLEIGKFAGVELDALRFGFDVVMRGSVAEAAELEIDEMPGQAFCFDCENTVTLNERLDPCPICGGGKLSPTGGEEMKIKDLEVV